MSEPRLPKPKLDKTEFILRKDFDDIFYKSIVSYVMRCTKEECKKFYHNRTEEIYRAFELLQLIYEDIGRYSEFDNDKGKENPEESAFYKITYIEFEKICKKYVDICREENSRFAGWVIFDLLVTVGELFEKDSSIIMFKDFESTVTKEDIKYANKHFSKQHSSVLNEDYKIKFNKDTCKIVNYRGLKIYEYVPWSVGYILDDNGKTKEFPIEWDWWYLIDKYIFLEKGWKK